MYPGSIVNWIDQTIEEEPKVRGIDNPTIFLTASSFDKGPEELKIVQGKEFYELYGTDNRFDKHGQPAIQAANIIDSGGILLVKRIVANDSTLSNYILLATLTRNNEPEPEPSEIVPSTAVTMPSQTDAWLGKNISELVADDIIVGEDGYVHGTIHYAKNFTGFHGTDPTQQEGYFFPFKLNCTGTTMTLKVDGVATADKTNMVFDPEVIFFIRKKPCSYEVEVDGTSIISLDFSKATFEPDPDAPAPAAEPAVETPSVGGDGEDVDLDAEDTEVEIKSKGTVKLSVVYVENCYTQKQVEEFMQELYDPENGVFPILAVCDVGRGRNTKCVRMTFNAETSFSVGHPFYNVYIYEGTKLLDSFVGTLDDMVYSEEQYQLNDHSSKQVKFIIQDDIYEEYVAQVSEIMGIDVSEYGKYDMVNMTDLKGVLLDSMDVDPESIDIGVEYGVELDGGSDGEFGEAPFDTAPYNQALLDFYTGQYTNEIYDLDEFKIGAVLDANYSFEVKEAIAELVTFREDCVFFRDMRFEANSYSTAKEVRKKFATRNKFIADYMTYYSIKDPHSKKRINVTMLYDMASCLIQEFDKGIHYPTAGIANGFVLKSAIEGTTNYTPRNTPRVKQKQLMDDLRVNYAIFQSGQCVVQSLYTSQEAKSQLSYVNNVLSIQEVIRSVRNSCPIKRYTFVTNSDFSEYAEHVNNILKNFKNNFDYLKLVYRQDNLMAHQKIFSADIKFAFKDWAQTEIFNVYAIPNDSINVDNM